MDKRRVRKLNNISYQQGITVYWMSRDQRVDDNWALICAQKMADGMPLAVVFNLVPEFIGASKEHYSFMAEGLKEVKNGLDKLKIPFFVLTGQPEDEIPKFIAANGVKCLVTDFSPLKLNRKWKDGVNARINIPFYEVDAHNVVPCFFVSQKQEYAARTIRPKINRLLGEFLTDFPQLSEQTAVFPSSDRSADKLVSYGHHFHYVSGSAGAHQMLDDFIDNRITGYGRFRNDADIYAQSHLSPYFHFGQLAPQRVAYAALRSGAPEEDVESFIEELVIRRELADNFCLYNDNYDSLNCAENWAMTTLNEHRKDPREYIYDYDQFLDADTHDPLWNAAQNEMRITGKMHGYMRMYWAKKILEWTPDPETAFEYAMTLNDTLALDGRDPNGYTGVAWSIAGTHDRAWTERSVFGKIRYMNYNGCRSKFSIGAYIKKIEDMDR